MENIWQIVIALIGATGGIAGLFTAIAYYKKIGKKYDIENESSEIKNLRDMIDILQKGKDDLDRRVKYLEEALSIKDTEIIKIEAECNKRKRAMNCQSLCEKHADECPIITKYKSLTDEKN